MPRRCSPTSAGLPPAGGRWRRRCTSAASARSSTGAATDRAYLDDVWRDSNVVRLDGKLDWPALSALIAAARVYIGPDTAITHLAAATGAPTVALYGPPIRGCGDRGRLAVSTAHGPPPARSSIAAMSGWCKIRCRACRANWKVASAGSTATANVSMSLRPARWCPRSIRRWRCGRRRSGLIQRRLHRRGRPAELAVTRSNCV